jgi:hypothetical protein
VEVVTGKKWYKSWSCSLLQVDCASIWFTMLLKQYSVLEQYSVL